MLANRLVTCQSGDVDVRLHRRPTRPGLRSDGEPSETRHDLERLAAPEDLADWIAARTTDSTDGCPSPTADLDDGEDPARGDLRRWSRRGLSSNRPAERHRRIVNAAAAQSPADRRRSTSDGRVASRTGASTRVLALLARDAIDLAAGPDLALVRWCATERARGRSSIGRAAIGDGGAECAAVATGPRPRPIATPRRPVTLRCSRGSRDPILRPR